jgi:hypothetical protein
MNANEREMGESIRIYSRVFAALLLSVLPALASGGVRCYDVEPQGNDNAWTGKDQAVSQTFVLTSDSLSWAEAFIGQPNGLGHPYTFRVMNSGNRVVYRGTADDSGRGWRYIHADLHASAGVPAPAKGSQLKFDITAASGDSVNYYRSSFTLHPSSFISFAPISPGSSLAARIEGANRVITKDFFGVNGGLMWHWPTTSLSDTQLIARMNDAGIGWDREYYTWAYSQPDHSDTVTNTFRWLGGGERFLIDGAERGIKFMLSMDPSPAWACSYPRVDTGISDSGQYPPIHLMEPVDSAGHINRHNYYANWIYHVVSRFKPHTKFWTDNGLTGDSEIMLEIGSEDNYWTVPSPGSDPEYDSLALIYGRGPALSEYLYARECDVAYEAARLADPERKVHIIVGGTGGVFLGFPFLIPGKDWLAGYYAYRNPAGQNAGISVHPYEYPMDTDLAWYPKVYCRDLDTVRDLMRSHGDENKELQATELAWSAQALPASDPKANLAALSIPQCYVAALAGDPTNFYNRIFWFDLYSDSVDSSLGAHAVLAWSAELLRYTGPSDSPHVETRRPCFYAYRQMTSELDGKRIIGRVLTGNPGIDSAAFLYEIEDPSTGQRSWVGWRKLLPFNSPAIAVRVPVQTNRLDTLRIDRARRSRNPRTFAPAGDGWFHVSLDSIPVYIHERDSVHRPDLVVDSVWTDPPAPSALDTVRFWARLRNVGNASTPAIGRSNRNPPVIFYANGVARGSLRSLPAIRSRATIDVHSDGTWTPAPGDCLIEAIGNEAKTFMETSFDNNASWRMYRIGAIY